MAPLQTNQLGVDLLPQQEQHSFGVPQACTAVMFEEKPPQDAGDMERPSKVQRVEEPVTAAVQLNSQTQSYQMPLFTMGAQQQLFQPPPYYLGLQQPMLQGPQSQQIQVQPQMMSVVQNGNVLQVSKALFVPYLTYHFLFEVLSFFSTRNLAHFI